MQQNRQYRSHRSNKLEHLLEAYLCGTLKHDDGARLEALLERDPGALEELFTQAIMDYELQRFLGQHRLVKSRTFLWIAACVVILVPLIMIGYLSINPQLGSVRLKSGNLIWQTADTNGWVASNVSSILPENFRFRAMTQCLLELNDHSRLSVSPGCMGSLHCPQHGGKKLHITRGKLDLDISPQARPFQLSTPNARITVLGTQFRVTVTPTRQTRVDLQHGKLSIHSEHYQTTITSGYSATIDGHGNIRVISPRQKQQNIRLRWSWDEPPAPAGTDHLWQYGQYTQTAPGNSSPCLRSVLSDEGKDKFQHVAIRSSETLFTLQPGQKLIFRHTQQRFTRKPFKILVYTRDRKRGKTWYYSTYVPAGEPGQWHEDTVDFTRFSANSPDFPEDVPTQLKPGTPIDGIIILHPQPELEFYIDDLCVTSPRQ